MTSLVAAMLVLSVSIGGCILDGRKNEPRISNESGVAIEIDWTAPGADDVHYADIAAGQVHGVFEHVASCAPYDMVAKTADGEVIARTPKPLCPGDLWVIEPPAATPTG